MLETLIMIFGLCLVIGVVYPVFVVLAYPFYRICGGKKKFREYIKNF